MKKTLSVLMFVAFLSASLLVGCSQSEEGITNPIDLIPEKADIVGYVELGRILGDDDIAELYEALPKEAEDPQTVEEVVALAVGMSGLDLMDFDEGWLFSDISDAGEADYFGVMLKGRFEESDLLANVESAIGEGFQIIDYRGYAIYAGSGEETGQAVLTSDVVVAGSIEAIKDVIAVREGDQPAVGGKLLDTYDGLGVGLAKVVALVPPGLVEQSLGELTAGMYSSPALDALSYLETVSVSIKKDGQSIACRAGLCFSDSGSAEAVQGLIPLVPLMLGVIDTTDGSSIQIPPEVLALVPELLNESEIDTSGTCLTLSLDLTVAETTDLLSG